MQAWEQRYWDISLKTNNPIEEFKKIMEAEDQEPPVDISRLPNEIQSWYRA